ncbi:MAG TPA: DNA polymerase Y family protein [Candidatus Binataceae bacterium]|nr:DNA polymerase Y family protein [Candidatus Binataceae bacterium]
MSAVACILVADFPIAALVRANPALDRTVLAIAQSLAPHAELSAVSPRARGLGIRPGMTIAQARAISSALVVRMRSEAAERSAHDALADAAQSVSPLIEPGEPGCVWAGLDGLARLFASEDEIAAELVRAARRVGLEVSVGIASNREVSRLAARCGGIRIIGQSREREFLDWLPLDSLDLGAADGGAELESTLARWGLRRLGELARLDSDALGSRLGRHGVELARLAQGGSSRPLAARPQAELFVESLELEYGIDTLEPLGFVLRPMLERLLERLSLRGLVAGELLLALGLDGHRVASRRVVAPSNDLRALLTLTNLALESEPPEAAVESIRIEIFPRPARPAQSDMFLPPAPAPERLQTTLAKLAALCGPENVGGLAPENSHRPEAVRLEPFAPPPPMPIIEAEQASAPVARLVLREVRPALEVEVLSNRGALEFVRGPNLGARVVSAAGPWRREGEWWRVAARNSAGSNEVLNSPSLHEGGGYGSHPRVMSTQTLKRIANDANSLSRDCGLDRSRKPGESLPRAGHERSEVPSRGADERRLRRKSGEGDLAAATQIRGYARDYYELALDDGGVYRVFYDLNSDRWFLDGIYD